MAYKRRRKAVRKGRRFRRKTWARTRKKRSASKRRPSRTAVRASKGASRALVKCKRLRRELEEVIRPKKHSYIVWDNGTADYENLISYNFTYVPAYPRMTPAANWAGNGTYVGRPAYGSMGALGTTLLDTTGTEMECARPLMYEPHILTEVARFNKTNHALRNALNYATHTGLQAQGLPLPRNIRESRNINILNFNCTLRLRFVKGASDAAADWVGGLAKDGPLSRQYVRVLLIRVDDMGNGDEQDQTWRKWGQVNVDDYIPQPMIRQDATHSAFTSEATLGYTAERNTQIAINATGPLQTAQQYPPRYRICPPTLEELFDEMPTESSRGYTDEKVLQRRFLSPKPWKNQKLDPDATLTRTSGADGQSTAVNDPGYGANVTQHRRRERRFKVLKDIKLEFINHGDGGRLGGRQIDLKVSLPLGKNRYGTGQTYMEGTKCRYFFYFMPSIARRINVAQPAVNNAGHGHPYFTVARIKESVTWRGDGKKDA